MVAEKNSETEKRSTSLSAHSSPGSPKTAHKSPRGHPGKVSNALSKTGVLGYDTRGVANCWLQPLGLRHAEEPAGQGESSPSRSSLVLTATGGSSQAPGTLRYSSTREFVQLSPHYGPGQNSPKELSTLRTTRALHQLGRAAIFSHSPYVNNAIETLIPGGSGTLQPAIIMLPPSPMHGPMLAHRPLFGRLPRKGSKAAAMQRARRLVSAHAPFLCEVPFVDAVRVCNLAGDKTAMPALLQAYVFSQPHLSLSKLEYYTNVLAVQPPLIQLQAAAQLLQRGYLFTAVKIVYSDLELLKATLEEMKLIVEQGMKEGDWEVAAATWRWCDIDKELFIGQFSGLRIVSYYLDVRRQLRALREQGAVALARVEREMLTKVIADFMAQVDEDAATQQQRDREEREAQRLIDEERRVEEEAKEMERAVAAEAARLAAAEAAEALAAEVKEAEYARARMTEEERVRAAERAELEAAAQRERDTEAEVAAQAAREAQALVDAEASEAARVLEEARAEREAQLAAEMEAQAVLDAQALADAEPAPEPEPEPRAGSQLEPQPQPQPEPELEPEVLPESQMEPKTESEHQTELEPESEHQTGPEPESEQQTGPEPESEHQTGPESDSEAKAEPEPEPGSEAQAEPEPQMEPEPEPDEEQKAEAGPSDTLDGEDQIPGVTADGPVAPGGPILDSPLQAEPSGPRPGTAEAELLTQAAYALVKAAQATDAQGARTLSRLGSASAASTALGAAANDAAKMAMNVALSAADRVEDASDADAGRIVSDIVGRALGLAILSQQASDGAIAVAADAVATSIAQAVTSRPGSRAGSRAGSRPPSRSLGDSLSLRPTSRPMQRSLRGTLRSGASGSGGFSSSGLKTVMEPDGGDLSTADREVLAETPQGLSRPGTAEGSRDGVPAGIDEMKRQLSESRRLVEEAAEKMCTSVSRPNSAARAAASKLAAEGTVEDLEAALHAQNQNHEDGQAAEREALFGAPGPSLSRPKTPLSTSHTPVGIEDVLNGQQAALEEQLEAKAEILQELEKEREKLRSASGRPPSRERADAEDRRLKEVEMRLAAEAAASAQLAEQREAIVKERKAMEEEKKAMMAATKAAMNQQVTRSMHMFQQQLAQTVKMAAMLQAQRIMTGGKGPSMSTVVPTINLPTEVDEPPSEVEIIEYARYLGMDPDADPDLVYVAEWALTAPVPDGWTVHLDSQGHEFFHNNVTSSSMYEHPMDEHYRRLYLQKREEKRMAAAAAGGGGGGAGEIVGR